MKYVSLETVCNILDSQRVPITASERTKGEYPYYGANGIQDYVAEYIFDDELVLLAEDGGNFGSKDRPIAYRVSGKCWVNNHAHVLKPKDCIDVDYLCYSLMFYDTTGIVNGATRQKLTQAAMRQMTIPMVSMGEQKDIVLKLNSIERLISQRKEQLVILDELVKSRFIELFGDPNDNPLNWKISDFKDVVYFQEGPGVRNWQFRDNGIKLINIRNLVDDNLVLENTNNYLSEQEVEEKYKHFLLDIGDYVMASSGVTWGKIAEIYEEHLPLCLNTSIIRLRPYDENVISKKYLFHYIKGDAFRTQIKRLITGSAQPNFGPTHLKRISILVPPIELQNQFAAFVEQTDKSKLAVQQSLEKLETLKKSLMQKYFG